MLRFFLLATFLFSTALVFSQQDTVFLKDGRKLTGKVTFYEIGRELKLASRHGAEIVVSDSEIHQVSLGVSPSSGGSAYSPKKRGFYGTVGLGIFTGSGDQGSYINTGLQLSGGYRIFPWLMVGLGVDFLPTFQSSSPSDYNLMPKFELRGSFGNRRFAPYYNMAFGYGFPMDRKHDSDWYQTSYKGSFYGYPSVGIRLGVGKSTDLHFDLGYVFYSPSYTYFSTGGSFWSNTYEYSFRNLALRAGVTF